MGHSLGARIITRAVFSRGIFDPKQTNASQKDGYDIDLVIGLEGAFSINRFISGKGKEGSPYSDFNKNNYVKKFIFTWSKYDWATLLAYWLAEEDLIGSVYGHRKSWNPEVKDIFGHYKIKVGKELLPSRDYDFKGVQKVENEQTEWHESFSCPGKISIVDASKLIKNKPYGKGGIAHSDIYTPGIARFIWDCIDNSKKSK